MAEERQATSGFDTKRTGASYASQWNRFVAWCEVSGRGSPPATPEDVAAYLNDRQESGAKPSTLKVVVAAVARSHREAGFDVSAQQGVARTVLDELTQDESPGPTRALPLDLDCYLAIRKVAKEQRSGRGGHEERVSNARRRVTLDVAMIGLMRNARLRVNEAAALTWGDVERVHGGSGRVRVADTDHRVVSVDTRWAISRPGRQIILKALRPVIPRVRPEP